MGNILIGIMIPFVGTTAGAGCVYFLKNGIRKNTQKMLLGFASGVMTAASVWSLLIPAMDLSASMGKLAFFPAAVGFLLGIAFLLFLDRTVPHLHMDCEEPEGPACALRKTTMLILAVTLHNIPEGMAVGVMFAGMLAESSGITLAAALALSIGIAIQNFPEGAIISLVEPVLPYLLAFAAGAMIYVVVEELIPESAEGEHSNLGTIGYAAGFVIMMILDVALG